MTTRSNFQGLKHVLMSATSMAATGADFAITEADLGSAGGGPARFVLSTGALGAAGITVFSIHASDTAGFTPGAGNLVKAWLTTDLPVGTDDFKNFILDVANVAKYGRYWSAIVTAGANACEASLCCFYEPTQSANSSAEKGADVAFVVG